MLDEIRDGGLGCEAPQLSRVWGGAKPPNICMVTWFQNLPNCPALKFTRLPNSFYPVVAQFLASGQRPQSPHSFYCVEMQYMPFRANTTETAKESARSEAAQLPLC